ncbi:MAG: aminoglycoside phosphotransferase family protein, partial [Actinoplanes sp.]
GGAVTYLTQLDECGGLVEEAAGGAAGGVAGDLRPHPNRPAYADPGGPAAAIAWARAALGRSDLVARQQRTWNLSAIWRLDEPGGGPVAWLKQVPHFFAHEAAAIAQVAAVAPGLTPPVLAAGEPGRLLMAHLPGEDCWDAGPEVAAEVAAAFHPVQAHYASHPVGGSIPVIGLDFAKVAVPHLDTIPGLRELIDDLPRRLAEIAACGLPDTLVHGDLHLGNVIRDAAGRLTIIDWGDCAVGHPGFDILRLGGRMKDPEPLYAAWVSRWRDSFPGADPRRALELLRPVAALRDAAVYAAFLDAIEPSEWPYHAADVPGNLTRAASMVGG